MVNDLFQADKAGDDTLTKDYSIAVVLNKEKVYGYRVLQKTQDTLINEFKRGLLGVDKRLRFKLRFHTSIIILILKQISIKNNKSNQCQIEICNDYDSHFHEIKDMILKNLKRDIPNLKKEGIVMQKFPKDSLVNKAAHNLYKKNNEELKDYNLCNLGINDLRELIKKSGNQG